MNNIYVSTACLSNKENVIKRIQRYINLGIYNIELGTNVTVDPNDISLLKSLNANLLLHNYFPPPKDDFILNLASQNKINLTKSINFVKNSIVLSSEINAPFYSIHAGFITDPIQKSNGDFVFKTPESKEANKTAYNTFKNSIKSLINTAKEKNVVLLIENNVCTKSNVGNLLLQTTSEFEKLFSEIDSDYIGILVDTGHLNVSAKTFNFIPEEFFFKLSNHIKAIHLHTNNGIVDQHKPIDKDGWIFKTIKNEPFKNKDIVIESKFDSEDSLKIFYKKLVDSIKV